MSKQDILLIYVSKVKESKNCTYFTMKTNRESGEHASPQLLNTPNFSAEKENEKWNNWIRNAFKIIFSKEKSKEKERIKFKVSFSNRYEISGDSPVDDRQIEYISPGLCVPISEEECLVFLSVISEIDLLWI